MYPRLPPVSRDGDPGDISIPAVKPPIVTEYEEADVSGSPEGDTYAAVAARVR